ncbi:hypothetical protein FXO38_23469 [Capsicum annuum]|nr:hypothetical protein FXO38_23469 [Capsicum annuum]
MDNVVLQFLENLDWYISSLNYSESSATMTEEKLVQQLDLFFMNLYDLPKPCAELIIPLRQRFIKNKSNIYDLSKLCVIGLAYKDLKSVGAPVLLKTRISHEERLKMCGALASLNVQLRKENLFDFISLSVPPPPPSDLMPCRMAIHYDHLDENFVLFSPEKGNSYVKQLFSLKIYMDDDAGYGKHYHLSCNCHLRHLRLLKRLELRKSLSKLQHVSIFTCSVFDLYVDEPTVLQEDSKLENLRILSSFNISYSNEDIFKRFPNLQNLKFSIREPWDCSTEQISFPRLDVYNELQKVSAHFHCSPFSRHAPEHQFCDFHFPSSMKKLQWTSFNLTSYSLSRIRSLPNLQDLRLRVQSSKGKNGTWKKCPSRISKC